MPGVRLPWWVVVVVVGDPRGRSLATRIIVALQASGSMRRIGVRSARARRWSRRARSSRCTSTRAWSTCRRSHSAARATRRWVVESPLRGEEDQAVGGGESIARRGGPGGEWRLESPLHGEGDQAVSRESIALRRGPGSEWRRVHCVARGTRRWVASPLRGEGHQAVSGESIARRGGPGGEWSVHCAARGTRRWVESPLRGEGDQAVSGESIARRGRPGGECPRFSRALVTAL